MNWISEVVMYEDKVWLIANVCVTPYGVKSGVILGIGCYAYNAVI